MMASNKRQVPQNLSPSDYQLQSPQKPDTECSVRAADEGTVSDSSSEETEGPDTVSIVSGSSETGGPDSRPISSDEDENGMIYHDEIQRGMVIRQGDAISFVSDTLNERIKLSSPSESAASTGSPRRSVTSDVCSGSMDSSPVDINVLAEMESEAKKLSTSVDKMLADVHSTLHTMSAVTVGCVQTYRGCVERTLNEVDANMKMMYTFMARCEQLNTSMKDLYLVAEQINDIKRILDMFEADLLLNSPQ